MKKKDNLLIWHLDQNARLPLTELARLTGSSKQGVRYRLTQLEERKIITGYYAVINFAAIGYLQYRCYFRFRRADEAAEIKAIDALKNNPYTFWVATAIGPWDLQVAFLAQNFLLLSNIFKDLHQPVMQHVSRKTHSLTIHTYHLTRDYFVNKKRILITPKKRAQISGSYQADKVDLLVLSILARNARKSVLSISEELNVSPVAVSARIEKFEKLGIIMRYRPAIDLTVLSINRYKVKLVLDIVSLPRLLALFAYCSSFPEVVHVSEVLGEWQVDIDIETDDQRVVSKIVGSIRHNYSDLLVDYEVMQLLDVHKINYLPFVNS